jgi:dTDP-L-rhamnose 4-epimerase
MAKVLVTGGAGFIGSHTADALAKKGHQVVILDLLTRPVHNGDWPKYVQKKGYKLIRGDVQNRTALLSALNGVSYVYHLAAYQDQRPQFSKFFKTNTAGTALLYELIVSKSLPVKKIILASTQFVYGDGKYQCPHNKQFFYPELRSTQQLDAGNFDILCPHGKKAKFYPFREDQPLTPTNSYGLSKEALERLGLRLGKTYDIPTTVLRYSIIQGSRQSPRNLYSGALRMFTVEALNGQTIKGYEDGKQIRDFTNIADAVSANLMVLDKPKSDYQIYNVGSGNPYRPLDLARMVKRISGSDSKIVFSGYRRTDSRNAVSDISKLKKLGWAPKARLRNLWLSMSSGTNLI